MHFLEKQNQTQPNLMAVKKEKKRQYALQYTGVSSIIKL